MLVFIKSFLIFWIQTNNTANLMGVIQPLTLMFWSFVVMFIYCDFGERISCGFESVHNAIEECDWHLFPNEMQRMLLIIMAADEPVVLEGFANVVMTRETFKKVAFFVIWPKRVEKLFFSHINSILDCQCRILVFHGP